MVNSSAVKIDFPSCKGISYEKSSYSPLNTCPSIASELGASLICIDHSSQITAWCKGEYFLRLVKV